MNKFLKILMEYKLREYQKVYSKSGEKDYHTKLEKECDLYSSFHGDIRFQERVGTGDSYTDKLSELPPTPKNIEQRKKPQQSFKKADQPQPRVDKGPLSHNELQVFLKKISRKAVRLLTDQKYAPKLKTANGIIVDRVGVEFFIYDRIMDQSILGGWTLDENHEQFFKIITFFPRSKSLPNSGHTQEYLIIESFDIYDDLDVYEIL